MKDCIFCKIAQGEMESEKIYETENTVAFLDINPKAPGHSLIIPRTHVEKLMNADEELICELFSSTKKVEKLLSSSIDPSAFTIGVNDGAEAGQEIPHLHINVIPRFKGDGGGPIQSLVSNPPEKEISEIVNIIKESP